MTRDNGLTSWRVDSAGKWREAVRENPTCYARIVHCHKCFRGLNLDLSIELAQHTLYLFGHVVGRDTLNLTCRNRSCGGVWFRR